MHTRIPPTVKRIGLIAGEGHLPLHVVRTAQQVGTEVVTYSFGGQNSGALKQACQGRFYRVVPGLLNQTLKVLQKENIEHLVFAGKVNKWILLRNPQLDARAIQLMKTHRKLNDDTIMHTLIDELAKEGIQVLSQTDYLQDLFLAEALLTPQVPPAEEAWHDIAYGFDLAKTMGRLDVGQTVVVKSGMVLAIEAIEGTDECLKRAGKLSRGKGGVVVKVAKPNQDQRFDVPTVGLRTLKRMKQQGLNILATEAHETLFLEPDEMKVFAQRHGITMISVSEASCRKALGHG